MPKRVPLVSLTLVRDKKRISVPPNTVFDFSAEELKAITEQEKSAGKEGQWLRKPVNEDPLPTTSVQQSATSTTTTTTTAGTGNSPAAAAADATKNAAKTPEAGKAPATAGKPGDGDL
ncbi:hypothetical protein XccvBFoX4_gp22 [Xanthomonas phage FoX4]|uniref:DUF7443 domain-containing protein n=1 Tax=Xanthomonas phage FoX4 TaxID=2723900 RepID=A0A858XBF8_9CAUD|nr:hypothetical protein KNU97_gp22 [Xanthomonas phage FoX4]QJI52976.1 hypothetical protein XccvBFoX4_gp22 [Xanthomonas phage FoX4]